MTPTSSAARADRGAHTAAAPGRRPAPPRPVAASLRAGACALALTCGLAGTAMAQGAPTTATQPAAGAAPVASGEWAFSAEVYGWLPTISATTQSGYDADIDIDTILEDLNYVFMGNVAMMRDRWALFLDAIYLDIDNSKDGKLQIGAVTVEDELDVRLKSFIATAGVGYEVGAASNYRVSVLGGARYLWMETDVDVSVGPLKGSVKDDETYVDGIVGVNARYDINDRWYLSGYADVGGGQSDLTWQALAAVSYRFDRFDLAVGYRYLEWQFDDGEPLDKLDVYGPYIGARFRF